MTRRLLIIAVLLVGLVIGYLAGCRSQGQSRMVTHEPQPGQHWQSPSGDERIVRCVVRDGTHVNVWWFRDGFGADRHCTLTTWRAWARTKGAAP